MSAALGSAAFGRGRRLLACERDIEDLARCSSGGPGEVREGGRGRRDGQARGGEAPCERGRGGVQERGDLFERRAQDDAGERP